MTMNTITIPVTVARAVTASQWAMAHPASDPAHEVYDQAARSRYWRKRSYLTAEDLRLLLEPIDAVLSEMRAASARATTLRPVEEFATVLRQAAERQAEADDRQKRENAEKAAATLEQARVNRRRRRETTMSGLIESGRQRALREICQDYGLEQVNPQIMAGLVAAYHAGVHHYRQVIDGVTYADPQVVPAEQVDALMRRDKALFADAADPATEG